MITNNEKNYGFGVVGVLLIVAIVFLFGFVGWKVWEGQKQVQESRKGAQTSNATVFKIPELDIEFDVKNNITPLYNITSNTLNNIKYEAIRFSTQQLIDKGAAAGEKNACAFSPIDWEDGYHSMMAVIAYHSQEDALAIERQANTNLTASDIKQSNGYIAIKDKIYAIPQGVRPGSSPCLQDNAFEIEQRSLLRESLMTLKAMR